MKMDWRGDKVIRAAEQAKVKALTKAALVVEDQAVNLVKVDTGNLKNSITHQVKGDEARIGTNTDYGPYQEFGTRKMPAQPYLRPAMDITKKEVEEILGDVIGKDIEGAGK